MLAGICWLVEGTCRIHPKFRSFYLDFGASALLPSKPVNQIMASNVHHRRSRIWCWAYTTRLNLRLDEWRCYGRRCTLHTFEVIAESDGWIESMSWMVNRVKSWRRHYLHVFFCLLSILISIQFPTVGETSGDARHTGVHGKPDTDYG